MTAADRFHAQVAASAAAGNVWTYPAGKDKGDATLPPQPQASPEPEPEAEPEPESEPAPVDVRSYDLSQKPRKNRR
jgi:hypothetical protein